MIPPHTLSIYQKPKQGNRFLESRRAFSYKHKIAAVGGFDTMQCDLAIPPDQVASWAADHLGNRLAAFADNPIDPIWEGLINRMTYSVGGLKYTISLDKLYNRIKVQYANVSTPTTTPATDDTDSQVVYGIKQGTFDANIQYTGTGSQVPTELRDHLINVHAWPRASISITTGGSSSAPFKLEAVGFYHTLDWEDWAFASNSAVDASVAIDDVIENLANGTTFLDNTARHLIQTNAAFDQNKLSRNGDTAWQFMQAVQEAGDGAGTPWVMGVTPTFSNTGTRLFYYRPANLNVEYTARLRDGLLVRNKYGQLVEPWKVRPDRGCRIADLMAVWNGLGDDPREFYVDGITYDANTQAVSLSSTDNIEFEGAFQLRKRFKTHDSRFGATVRNSE